MSGHLPQPPANPSPSVLRTASDVQAVIAAQRAGHAFLVGCSHEGRQVIFPLPPDRWRHTVGRKPESDVSLGWDNKVSRAHALLERVCDQWTLVDDGLSKYGSSVNGTRVRGRQRLRDGDRLWFGNTELIYHDPAPPESEPTAREPSSTAIHLSPTQRKVLIALCRPVNDSSSPIPATNRQIADEVFLSVEAVKAHLKALFGRFGVADLPPIEKRNRLAHAVLAAGALAPRDF